MRTDTYWTHRIACKILLDLFWTREGAIALLEIAFWISGTLFWMRQILFASSKFKIEFAGSWIEFGRSWIELSDLSHDLGDLNQDLADLNQDPENSSCNFRRSSWKEARLCKLLTSAKWDLVRDICNTQNHTPHAAFAYNVNSRLFASCYGTYCSTVSLCTGRTCCLTSVFLCWIRSLIWASGCNSSRNARCLDCACVDRYGS